MGKWEYRFIQLQYVEYESSPQNWKAKSILKGGEVGTVLLDAAEELEKLGDEGWEIVGVVPGGPIVPSRLDEKGRPLTPSTLDAPVGPRAGGLVILQRPKA